ncbi:dynamin family protein [Polyangium aurulentum]|uniref:dynamin family protein n=1 Tax=Polyangium aurulentum TaxID=2567896 RepID=UPI0010AEDA84|nr:dynamin family protein [Polyangium aurulentum]UQA62525.1 dynamin family protein [Polyangium aurulentum]
MWSPEGRKQNARELRQIADKVLRYRQLCDRFASYFQPDSDNARQLRQIRGKLEELRARALDREKRLAKGVVKIGVVGLEKQGKSAFLSAWLKSEKLLPSEAERCTWSTTVLEPGEAGQFSATVTYYKPEEFKTRIQSYFDALEPGSAERWQGLNPSEILRLKAAFKAREGYEVDDPDRAGRREQTALAELNDIAAGLSDIKAKLGKDQERITAASLDDLAEQIRPFIALKDTKNGNRPYPGVRAVKIVTVNIPVEGAMPGVELMDLPGIDAPSDKARRDTEEALANDVDVTIFVKDITRPSLVRNEVELLRMAQTADRSISLKDRIFVVLTKVDLFDHPDENGNWHWSLAARNFREQGVDRIFPYSKVWVHKGVDTSHPVARQLMDFFGTTTPVNGLDKLKEAVERYLSTDVEALDRKVTTAIQTEFGEAEALLRGVLVTVKDGLSDREFDRRAEQVFDLHYEHIQSGEDPVGLLPEIRKRLSAFMDFEMSEAQRGARAERADARIDQIRKDLYARLTPEEAEAKRRQMPSPGLMNETAVEIEMRKQMRERVASRIAGLGEDFRNTARESVERMLHGMFVEASYETGKLEVLLPPGEGLIARIDVLGRSGHVSESVVRYQNQEMAKADVAFEVLSRYFARQIVDILDATDPYDREIREREMRGLEQFFGMGIADKAQGPATSAAQSATQSASDVIGSVKAKLGFGQTAEGDGKTGQQQQAIGGFPTVGAAMPVPGKPAEAQKPATAPPAGTKPPQPTSPGAQGPQAGVRDWSKMLARVKADVDRICDFLEALAKHPRGLQKYHEEAVRTVHDSWLDREGEQSLRRWVRSECARIWPHKFAAIEAEKERARADIEALEELFGASGASNRKAEPAKAGTAANAPIGA